MAFARTAPRTAQRPTTARKTFASRYMIVPCEAEGASDLAVIWDRQEEQVVDVISAYASRHYSEEDALWDEFHAPASQHETHWHMAA